jgi:hypothetical protein
VFLSRRLPNRLILVEINTKFHLIFQAMPMTDLNGPKVISYLDYDKEFLIRMS